jgi:hypothetical protein
VRAYLLVGLAFVSAISLSAMGAQAATTLTFLDLCSRDETVCATRIRQAQAALEHRIETTGERKICVPPMGDEGLVGEITYWISETGQPEDQDDISSIEAALIALYSCKQD